MSFNLQTAIDIQQKLVLSLQAKAANSSRDAETLAALASAIAGLRDLQAMANKPQPTQTLPVTPPYQIR